MALRGAALQRAAHFSGNGLGSAPEPFRILARADQGLDVLRHDSAVLAIGYTKPMARGRQHPHPSPAFLDEGVNCGGQIELRLGVRRVMVQEIAEQAVQPIQEPEGKAPAVHGDDLPASQVAATAVSLLVPGPAGALLNSSEFLD